MEKITGYGVSSGNKYTGTLVKTLLYDTHIMQIQLKSGKLVWVTL